MMASFYYQDQNAVSGLYVQVNLSSCLMQGYGGYIANGFITK